MSLPIPLRTVRPTRSRSRCARGATVALLTLLALAAGLAAGCGEEVSREFRRAAMGSIQSGVRSVANGVLDGLFALAEPSGGESGGG